MGSPTLQKVRPIPMPAEISMAYQDKVENSGNVFLPQTLK